MADIFGFKKRRFLALNKTACVQFVNNIEGMYPLWHEWVSSVVGSTSALMGNTFLDAGWKEVIKNTDEINQRDMNWCFELNNYALVSGLFGFDIIDSEMFDEANEAIARSFYDHDTDGLIDCEQKALPKKLFKFVYAYLCSHFNGELSAFTKSNFELVWTIQYLQCIKLIKEMSPQGIGMPSASPADIANRCEVKAIRLFAYKNKCAPTEKTSNIKILEVRDKVESQFGVASEKKDEKIPDRAMTRILTKFYTIYETFGDEVLDQHLEYECKKYIRDGLRPEYLEH